jgi:hypothetical protein
MDTFPGGAQPRAELQISHMLLRGQQAGAERLPAMI